MILLSIFAFFAGLVTVLSPCVLPVLPAILSGTLTGGKLRPLGIVLGLIFSFSFFTLALSFLVQQFGISANFLRYFAIIIIGFFGLVMIMPYLADWFAKVTSFVGDLGAGLQSQGKQAGHGFLSGIILGIALGLVWTPCAGPILAAITTLVATQKITLDIVLLTLSYSLGAGLPLLLIAYGGKKAISGVPFLSRNSEIIRKGFGWIMLLTALALAFNWDVAFQQKVLEYLPGLQVENNQWVTNQLSKLRPNPLGAPQAAIPEELKNLKDNSNLPKVALAPNFEGITDWINSPPLTIKDLKGKVVLVDFWTYSCINCIRTFPYLRHWYDSYKDKGFTIVGVHTPEFEFEKDLDNVKKAVQRFEIKYPVALDNKYGTWQAYGNAYWPADYLIDQNGIIREIHYGEGKYLETENDIRALLGLSPLKEEFIKESKLRMPMTPETYLGYDRGRSYINKIVPDKVYDYSYKEQVGEDQVALKGLWKVENEKIISESDDSTLALNFEAGRVYLVIKDQSQSNKPITVEMDGKPIAKENYTKDMDDQGRLYIKDARKYDIVDLKGKYGRHLVVLHVPKGIELYAFTFGLEE